MFKSSYRWWQFECQKFLDKVHIRHSSLTFCLKYGNFYTCYPQGSSIFSTKPTVFIWIYSLNDWIWLNFTRMFNIYHGTLWIVLPVYGRTLSFYIRSCSALHSDRGRDGRKTLSDEDLWFQLGYYLRGLSHPNRIRRNGNSSDTVIICCLNRNTCLLDVDFQWKWCLFTGQRNT